MSSGQYFWAMYIVVNSVSFRYLEVSIDDVGKVCEVHNCIFVIFPFFLAESVGFLVPVCSAVGQHVSCDVAAWSTTEVPVTECDLSA